jgi:hypothetical protein
MTDSRADSDAVDLRSQETNLDSSLRETRAYRKGSC